MPLFIRQLFAVCVHPSIIHPFGDVMRDKANKCILRQSLKAIYRHGAAPPPSKRYKHPSHGVSPITGGCSFHNAFRLFSKNTTHPIPSYPIPRGQSHLPFIIFLFYFFSEKQTGGGGWLGNKNTYFKYMISLFLSVSSCCIPLVERQRGVRRTIRTSTDLDWNIPRRFS